MVIRKIFIYGFFRLFSFRERGRGGWKKESVGSFLIVFVGRFDSFVFKYLLVFRRGTSVDFLVWRTVWDNVGMEEVSLFFFKLSLGFG